jgi:hypothetical protein
MYVVRKLRNQDVYSVKSKESPLIVYLIDKEQAKRLAERLNQEKGEGAEISRVNTY